MPRRTPRDARRRALGQNFLHDHAVVAEIVGTLHPPSGALVVDLGAGAGALTSAVAARGARVLAVEVDPAWVRELRSRAPGWGDVTVLAGDALRVPFPAERFSVVSSAPYGIGTKLVRRLLTDAHGLVRAVVVLQREAALRLAGGGRFAAAWAPWFELRVHGRIPARAFRPAPSVESAILTVVPRPVPLLSPAAYPGYDSFCRRRSRAAAPRWRSGSESVRARSRRSACRATRPRARSHRRPTRACSRHSARARDVAASDLFPVVPGRGFHEAGFVVRLPPSSCSCARRRSRPGRRRVQPGIGDPLFPGLGNGGYDVQHYDVGLRYGSAFTDPVEGNVTILARATQALSRFNLDFAGRSVGWRRRQRRAGDLAPRGSELVITPRKPIGNGSLFLVTVSKFVAVPTVPGDDPASVALFVHKSGTATAPQPDLARYFLPSNDHPRDKASFDFRFDVPAGRTAVANGVPLARWTAGGRRTRCSSSASRWRPS